MRKKEKLPILKSNFEYPYGIYRGDDQYNEAIIEKDKPEDISEMYDNLTENGWCYSD